MSYRPSVYKPFPELVEGQRQAAPYEILDTTHMQWLPSQGMTDLERRRVLVPLNAAGQLTSRHEMAHVRWSPTRIPKVRYPRQVFLAVEDARINLGLTALGLPLELSPDDRAWVTELAGDDLKRGDVVGYVLRIIASLGTNAVVDALLPAAGDQHWYARTLARKLSRRVRQRLLRGRARHGGPVTTVRHTVRIARDVARELIDAGHLDPDAAEGTTILTGHGCGLCCAGDAVIALPHEGQALDAVRAELLARLPDGEHLGPGAMAEVVAPLDVACLPAAGGYGRGYRPASEGSIVSYVHRHPLDRAIFRRRVRRAGGSVLIDTSGSMKLQASDVDRLLEHAPRATLVAIYSGRVFDGELRIVARGGRRAQAGHLVPYGRGNIVDLPALQWLAMQPAPRVWISDGGVTGIADTPSKTLRARCLELCRRANIRTVAGVEQAAGVLEERRHGWSPGPTAASV